MKKQPCFFVVGLLILSPALLPAQDDSPQKDTGPGLEQGHAVSHSVGVQYSTLTGSRPDEVLPYQAAGLIQVGYSGAVLSPEFKLVATTDLGSLAFADVKSTAALNFGLGVCERTLVVSAETSLFASPGDTKFQGQLNWDHLVGGVSLGVAEALSAPRFDYGFSLGWRF